MLVQIDLDELGEREPPSDPSLPSKPFELALEGVTGVLLGCEPATLNTLGTPDGEVTRIGALQGKSGGQLNSFPAVLR